MRGARVTWEGFGGPMGKLLILSDLQAGPLGVKLQQRGGSRSEPCGVRVSEANTMHWGLMGAHWGHGGGVHDEPWGHDGALWHDAVGLRPSLSEVTAKGASLGVPAHITGLAVETLNGEDVAKSSYDEVQGPGQHNGFFLPSPPSPSPGPVTCALPCHSCSPRSRERDALSASCSRGPWTQP